MMIVAPSADPCPHRRVVEAVSGGWHFSQGEPWDDEVVRLICLDCGEELPEPESAPVSDEESIDELPF